VVRDGVRHDFTFLDKYFLRDEDIVIVAHDGIAQIFFQELDALRAGIEIEVPHQYFRRHAALFHELIDDLGLRQPMWRVVLALRIPVTVRVHDDDIFAAMLDMDPLHLAIMVAVLTFGIVVGILI
jgi:hypothetical protein